MSENNNSLLENLSIKITRLKSFSVNLFPIRIKTKYESEWECGLRLKRDKFYQNIGFI
jgi:hypothetical protein